MILTGTGSGGAAVIISVLIPDRLRRLLLKLPLLASLGSFVGVRAGEPPWHRPDGTFANNYSQHAGGIFELIKAFSGQWPPRLEFPIAEPRPDQFSAAAARPTITWIGHATFLIQIGGLNILTDPHFSDRASPLSFWGAPRTTSPSHLLEQLPPIDVVLISHNHYDHLDSRTIGQLRARSRKTVYLVPLKLAAWFGFGDDTVFEYDWWEGTEVGGVRFDAVPTQHWSNRSGFDRNRTLWCSWVVEAAGRRLLFVGDSGYSPDYRDIGARFAGFDLAILPIGAYNPRWFMKVAHQNPSEAAQARRDLGARRAVASHWGTFQLTLEPMDEPPQKLAEALREAGEDEDIFWVLQHGETRAWG